MDKKVLVIIGFILLALVQLFVPAQMIWDREAILETGNEFKFRTAPIDPNDPFRGKYITLNFENTSVKVDSTANWNYGETVYVMFYEDAKGFAHIKSASKEIPENSEDYLKVKVTYASNLNNGELHVQYPFERYYMEESKAPKAEEIYRETQVDTSQVAYALVRIKQGEAVLKDVLVDGVPIRDLVKSRTAEK